MQNQINFIHPKRICSHPLICLLKSQRQNISQNFHLFLLQLIHFHTFWWVSILVLPSFPFFIAYHQWFQSKLWLRNPRHFFLTLFLTFLIQNHNLNFHHYNFQFWLHHTHFSSPLIFWQSKYCHQNQNHHCLIRIIFSLSLFLELFFFWPIFL